MFSHIINVPIVDDCISLLLHMTKITMSFDIKLSIGVFKNILNFNPKDCNDPIPNINTLLNYI